MAAWLWNLIYGAGYTVGQEIRRLIYDAVNGAISWVSNVLIAEKNAWPLIYNAVGSLEYGTWQFGAQVNWRLWWLRFVGIPYCITAAANRSQQIVVWAQGWFTYLQRRMEDNRSEAWGWITALTWTILHVIVPPIMGAIATLVKQMGEWAYVAWYFITHPPSLAGILFWPLFNIFQFNPFTIGRTIGDWLLKLVLQQFVVSSKLVEQIVADVL